VPIDLLFSLLAHGDERNSCFDLTYLRAMRDYHSRVGILEDVGEKVRWISELKDQKRPASTESRQTGNYIVGTSREKDANEAVSTDPIAAKTPGKSLNFVIKLDIRVGGGLVFEGNQIRRSLDLRGEQSSQVLGGVDDGHSE
jgi:hypothetical protein